MTPRTTAPLAFMQALVILTGVRSAPRPNVIETATIHRRPTRV